MSARGTLAALLVLAIAGCGGGGDKPAPAKPKQQPAEEGAPASASHTPDSCMLKAGLESIDKPSKNVWSAFHPDGYAIRVQKYNSPAAAHRAVAAASGVAQQANFFGIFGPVQDADNRAGLKVARCLLAL
jgi:hypothetical protein